MQTCPTVLPFKAAFQRHDIERAAHADRYMPFKHPLRVRGRTYAAVALPEFCLQQSSSIIVCRGPPAPARTLLLKRQVRLLYCPV